MTSGHRLAARLVRFWCYAWMGLVVAAQTIAQQPADPPAVNSKAKTKKVWTNDDLPASEGSSAVAAKANSSSTHPATEPNAQLAAEMRAKLEKLDAQLKDAEKQINELKRFQAGDTNGATGRQVNRGYNRTPISEQIESWKPNGWTYRTRFQRFTTKRGTRGFFPDSSADCSPVRISDFTLRFS